MSLDDLIESEQEDEEQEADVSGLAGMVGMKQQHEKLRRADMCPTCETTNTEEVSYYWRCNNSSCDTLTYISTDFTVDLSEFW